MVCFGTLLGPEGPGDRCLNLGLPAGARRSLSERRRRGGVGQILVGRPVLRYATGPGLHRPYLENCTVDASIKYFVAKLIRAHGGCLGTRSR